MNRFKYRFWKNCQLKIEHSVDISTFSKSTKRAVGSKYVFEAPLLLFYCQLNLCMVFAQIIRCRHTSILIQAETFRSMLISISMNETFKLNISFRKMLVIYQSLKVFVI